jgi:hypothetical protein
MCYLYVVGLVYDMEVGDHMALFVPHQATARPLGDFQLAEGESITPDQQHHREPFS